MAEHNEGTAEELEEVSGRWLRDQLREVAEGSQPPPKAPQQQGDASSAQLIEGLAASISAAVAEPIRGLESRREARQTKLEESLREISAKLGDAFVEIAKVRDRANVAGAAAEESREEARREIAATKEDAQRGVEAARAESVAAIESLSSETKAAIESLGSETTAELDRIRAQHREELDRATAATSDLRSSFNSLAEEIGRLQEKVREQHERIDALRFRETQRAKAMNELAKASSSLREALTAAAAMSTLNEDESGAAARG